MHTVFKIIIWFLLIWSGYHLVRDLLQDVFKIHHPLIDVLHMRPRHVEHFMGTYYRFWGIPLELGTLFLAIRSITTDHFGWEGSVAVGFFATFFSFWAWSSF